MNTKRFSVEIAALIFFVSLLSSCSRVNEIFIADNAEVSLNGEVQESDVIFTFLKENPESLVSVSGFGIEFEGTAAEFNEYWEQLIKSVWEEIDKNYKVPATVDEESVVPSDPFEGPAKAHNKSASSSPNPQ